MNENELLASIDEDIKIQEWDVESNRHKLEHMDAIMLKFRKELKNAIQRAEQEISLLQEQYKLLQTKETEVKQDGK